MEREEDGGMILLLWNSLGSLERKGRRLVDRAAAVRVGDEGDQTVWPCSSSVVQTIDCGGEVDNVPGVILGRSLR